MIYELIGGVILSLPGLLTALAFARLHPRLLSDHVQARDYRIGAFYIWCGWTALVLGLYSPLPAASGFLLLSWLTWFLVLDTRFLLSAAPRRARKNIRASRAAQKKEAHL